MTADSGGRTPNEMVGCFNITASLDHLDYDCVVVAGSVHVLGQCAEWSFRHVLSLPVSPRNESIPQSIPRFTVGLALWPIMSYMIQPITCSARKHYAACRFTIESKTMLKTIFQPWNVHPPAAHRYLHDVHMNVIMWLAS